MATRKPEGLKNVPAAIFLQRVLPLNCQLSEVAVIILQMRHYYSNAGRFERCPEATLFTYSQQNLLSSVYVIRLCLNEYFVHLLLCQLNK